MLAFEKFLCERQAFKNFPIPSEKGFLAYQKVDNKVTTINFLFFSVETIKNSLSTYNFKFTTVEVKPNKERNDCLNKVVEVDWENFYKSMEELRENIKKSDSYIIAETVDEADYFIWKSFVIINDSWFSTCFMNFPSSFFESLNEEKSFSHRNVNKRKFIEYLKENHRDMYLVWNKYFDREYCEVFCNWFYNFFYSN